MSAVRRFAPALAAAPVLACCAAAVVPGEPRAAAVAARSPLGVTAHVAASPGVPGGRTVFAPFLVRNTGDEPMDLVAVEPDCGCLAPLVDREAFDPAEPRTIQPGGAAVLILRADTAREPAGPSEHVVNLAVRTASGETHRQAVRMRYRVDPHELKVDPPGIIVMQNAGAVSTRTITVTDTRPNPIEVVAVRSPVDYVSAAALDPVPLPGGGAALPFEVTVAGGRTADVTVAVEVRDPAGIYKVLKLPVLCRPGVSVEDLKRAAAARADVMTADAPR